MITLTRILPCTTVNLKLTELFLLRLLSVSLANQKMSETNAPPSGAFRLNPLHVKLACDDRTSSDQAADAVEIHEKSKCDIDEKESAVKHVLSCHKMSLEKESVTQETLRSVKSTMKSSKCPGKSFPAEKTSILPPGLLKEVTKMVKLEVVTVPSSCADQEVTHVALTLSRIGASSNVTNMSLFGEDIINKQSTQYGKLSCSEELEDSGIMHDKSAASEGDTPMLTLDLKETKSVKDVSKHSGLVEGVEAETDVLTDEIDASVTHEDMADPFRGVELDETDVKAKMSLDETRILPDIEALFTGELEKRRKKELKKAKFKSWKKETEKYKRKKKNKDKVEEAVSESEDDSKKQRIRRPAVNYFIAIQISNPKILEALTLVQREVVSACQQLSPAMNKPATLHLTLFVLSIETNEDMQRSKQALDEAQKKLQPLHAAGPLSLDIAGLGHFRHEVVFAKVKPEDQVSQLQHIVGVVEECFLDQGIMSPDKKGFKPHLTIMKLSFLKGKKRKGLKKIDEKLYADHVDAEFGAEKADSLQLCSMLKKKQESGYYHVEHTVKFAASREDMDELETTVENIMEVNVTHPDNETTCEDETAGKDNSVSDLGDNTCSCSSTAKVVTESGVISGNGKLELENSDQEHLDESADGITEAGEPVEDTESVRKLASQTGGCATDMANK